ncbi:MAG TPA: c-type cytochrome [Candidatus Sulfotelmatobacter sp.]|nr:c-type cytochrome [Candidatus Sulfotelmatobacter sp.]
MFIARCSVCHGYDGSAQTQVGRALYPKPPDLRQPPTQELTDGEIHYIIQNGVRLTGMPAWSTKHAQPEEDSWKLVLFIRQLREPSTKELQAQTQGAASAHFVGSHACAK